MKRFCGRYQNRKGDQLVISQVTKNEAVCDFISGSTKKPIKRPYLQNRLTVQMKVEFDYYESGVEIDLGRELKWCLEDLDYPLIAQNLSGGISRPFGEEFEYLEEYISLFGLEPFQRIV